MPCGSIDPFRADEWLLYDQSAISSGSGRGLAGGAIFTADGTLAVTVVQEGLARVGPPLIARRTVTASSLALLAVTLRVQRRRRSARQRTASHLLDPAARRVGRHHRRARAADGQRGATGNW